MEDGCNRGMEDGWNRGMEVVETEGWRMVDMQIFNFRTSNFPMSTAKMETKISNLAIKIRKKLYILNLSSCYFQCFMVTKSK